MAVLLDHQVPGDAHYHPLGRVSGAGAAHSLATATDQSGSLYHDHAGLRNVLSSRQGNYHSKNTHANRIVPFFLLLELNNIHIICILSISFKLKFYFRTSIISCVVVLYAFIALVCGDTPCN